MLLDRVRQRRDAIRQIGAEAAEQARALGIEPVNVVYPEPEKPIVVRRIMMLSATLGADAPEQEPVGLLVLLQLRRPRCRPGRDLGTLRHP